MWIPPLLYLPCYLYQITLCISTVIPIVQDFSVQNKDSTLSYYAIKKPPFDYESPLPMGAVHENIHILHTYLCVRWHDLHVCSNSSCFYTHVRGGGNRKKKNNGGRQWLCHGGITAVSVFLRITRKTSLNSCIREPFKSDFAQLAEYRNRNHKVSF